MSDQDKTAISGGQPAQTAAAGSLQTGSKWPRKSDFSRAWWRCWNSFLLWWHPAPEETHSRSSNSRHSNRWRQSRFGKACDGLRERFWKSAFARRYALLLERFYSWWYPVTDDACSPTGRSVRRRKSRPGMLWNKLKRRVRSTAPFRRAKDESAASAPQYPQGME